MKQDPLQKQHEMIKAVLTMGNGLSLPDLAESVSIPLSSLHRHLARMTEQGLLMRVGPGRYIAGPALLALTNLVDPSRILAEIARPILRRIAARKAVTAHLGVWDGEMVTYLVKEAGVQQDLFTREGSKLEAYCSAIGRVLLTHLSETETAVYLASGPFVPLTEHSQTDPLQISFILNTVRQNGFAMENEEIAIGLSCLAVPVFGPDGSVFAAISIATQSKRDTRMRHVKELQDGAEQISRALASYTGLATSFHAAALR